MMEMESGVPKQLELEFASKLEDTPPLATIKAQSQVICFYQAKKAWEEKARLNGLALSDEIIQSRIDSLLSRYK